MSNTLRSRRIVSTVLIAGAGAVAGAIFAITTNAFAAGTTPTPSSSASTDAHPGDNGADGIPESQEHHGRGGGGHLSLSGTVTAVSSSSVTIKTSSGTTVYTVNSSSDIDKNGEATLSDLKAGDAVTFSVDSSNAKLIDKLHSGDEAKNRPQAPSDTSSTGTGA